MVVNKTSTVDEEKELPKKSKIRRIIIEIDEDDIRLSKDSQHASMWEVISILQAMIQSINIKK